MQATALRMDETAKSYPIIDRFYDRYIGTLLGLSIGDALGMPLEFLTEEEIKRRYGEKVTHFEEPFHDHPNASLVSGQYTDDTQIAIFLAETLIENSGFNVEDFTNRLVSSGSKLRGLGRTTKRMIKRLRKDKKNSGIYSLGCGPLTRAIPLGLWYEISQQESYALISDAFDSAKITHTHPEALTGAALVAGQIAYLKTEDPKNFNRQNFLDWSQTFLEVVDKFYASEHVSSSIHGVLRDVQTALPYSSTGAKKILKNGGSASDVLGVALYSLLKNTNFESTISCAVMFGGDADSHGALAGAYAGALYGKQDIPMNLSEKVENAQETELIAQQLFSH